jgi:hypothetical protein
MLALDECLNRGKTTDLAKCVIMLSHFEHAAGRDAFTNSKSPQVRH